MHVDEETLKTLMLIAARARPLLAALDPLAYREMDPVKANAIKVFAAQLREAHACLRLDQQSELERLRVEEWARPNAIPG